MVFLTNSSMAGFVKDVRTLLVLAIVALSVTLYVRPIIGKYLTINIVLGVPFVGVLVRLRTNYVPKRSPLDVERSHEEGDTCTGVSYAGMFRKVLRVEGFGSLYKGTVPALLEYFTVVFSCSFAPCRRPWTRDLIETALHQFHLQPSRFRLARLLEILLFLPLKSALLVLSLRAVSTPYALPLRTRVSSALRALLSSEEYEHPWSILFSKSTVAILSTSFVHEVCFQLVLPALRKLAERALDEAGSRNIEFALLGRMFVIDALVLVLSALLLCPLQVVLTRLIVGSHNCTAQGINSGNGNTENTEENTPLTTNKECAADTTSTGLITQKRAFRVRPQPYGGALDCVRLIIAEEGPHALWKGWWATLLSISMSYYHNLWGYGPDS
ncbi:hypothetical protein M0805_001384 [Coniferiporia weirii]|nr:hypothetical protein M0805_001384 [Coniferiporia weirii]